MHTLNQALVQRGEKLQRNVWAMREGKRRHKWEKLCGQAYSKWKDEEHKWIWLVPSHPILPLALKCLMKDETFRLSTEEMYLLWKNYLYLVHNWTTQCFKRDPGSSWETQNTNTDIIKSNSSLAPLSQRREKIAHKSRQTYNLFKCTGKKGWKWEVPFSPMSTKILLVCTGRFKGSNWESTCHDTPLHCAQTQGSKLLKWYVINVLEEK